MSKGETSAGAAQYEPQTEKGRATRRAILDAAEEVFGEHSYDGASVAEIVRRAGVAQGTFYVYFPDKKAAFVELVHELNHDLRRTIAMAVDGLNDRLEIERVGFVTFMEYVLRHKALYRVVRESQFVDPPTYRWHYKTLAEGYVRGLEKAQADGQITTSVSAQTMAWVLMGITVLLGDRWVLWEDRVPPDEVVDEVMRFIACSLRPGSAS